MNDASEGGVDAIDEGGGWVHVFEDVDARAMVQELLELALDLVYFKGVREGEGGDVVNRDVISDGMREGVVGLGCTSGAQVFEGRNVRFEVSAIKASACWTC